MTEGDAMATIDDAMEQDVAEVLEVRAVEAFARINERAFIGLLADYGVSHPPSKAGAGS